MKRPSAADRRVRTQQRFVREVQYVLAVGVDGVPGETETWPAWSRHKEEHWWPAQGPVQRMGDRLHDFVADVQVYLGLKPNGYPSLETFKAWARHAYPEVIAAGVFPIPRYAGADPVMSSAFNSPLNLGPNFWRPHDPKNDQWGHGGVDLGFKRDMSKPPPAGWEEHHFGYRPERAFYGPPVPVYAVLPGEVLYARLRKTSPKWGGPRWNVKIDHGVWPNLGHVQSWSVHHQEVLVRENQAVEADTPIALLGDTGAKGAPHDHHEKWRWRPGESVTDKTKRFDPWPIYSQLRVLEVEELTSSPSS